MKDCNWTEKVSLLIDGELAAVEARAVEQHLGDCFACRLAREDFLLLRHQISTYRPEVNLLAQRRALGHILGAAATARPSASAGKWRERASGLFVFPRFAPALIAASALVLVALVVGLLMFLDKTPNEVAENPQPGVANPTPDSSRSIKQDKTPAPAPDAEVAKIQPGGGQGIGRAKSRAGSASSNDLAKRLQPKRANNADIDPSRPTLAALSGETDDLPLIIPPRILADTGASDVAEVAAFVTESRPEADPSSLSASRHAEQAQQLLRAFRNADAGAGADLAYERGRSQALLYQNILLRREAASRGNVAVESVLGSLEPILLDIANLSDHPAREDVRSINERMKKKDIVAQLQIAARD